MVPMDPQSKHINPANGEHAPTTHRVHESDLTGELDGWRFEAPQRGRHGITVWAPDAAAPQYLPGIAGRYERGAGIIYLLPQSWGGLHHAAAVDLARGESWTRIGEHDAARVWKPTDPRRRIWEAVADTWPLTSPSPRVTEGRPPLAPALEPVQGDRDAARAEWGALAGKLAPAGRWVIGAALMSPWIEEVGGTSTVVSLWGEAGEGKSLLARIAAALYGTPADGAGLFGTFDSSGQGISSAAQSLAYLPMILDEAQSATAAVEPQLIALVMGAQRKRANREGASVQSRARWAGMALTTGNAPLELRHEMFSRRLIEVEVPDLWHGAPAVERWQERSLWWAGIAGALPTMAGWPWHDLTAQYEPGTPEAARVVDFAPRYALPGPGSLGLVGRLGVMGAQWLADWTGTPEWGAGVWDAAAALIAAQAEAAPDPARDAARAVVEDLAASPGMWVNPGAEHAPREVRGWHEHALGEECMLAHPEPCSWLNVLAGPFRELSPVPLARLGRTAFRSALYTTDAEHLTRKVRLSDGGRPRVVTACLEALDVLSDPAPVRVAPEGTPDEWPEELTEETAPVARVPSLFDAEAVEARAVEPQAELRLDALADRPRFGQAPAPVTPDAEDPEAGLSRVFGWSDDEDLGRALGAAVAAGHTDVVGPQVWQSAVHAGVAGWDARGWSGQGAGRMYRRGDGAAVRVWPIPTGRTTPELYARGLEEFTAYTGLDVRTVPTLAHRLLIEHRGEGVKSPRWQLPDEQAELWTTGAVLHPRQWGDRHAEAVQYDRVRSYLPALTQARLAPLWYGERFEVFGPDAPGADRGLGGMYRIVVPEWSSPLPAPHAGAEPGTEVWTTPEVMRLYAEVGVEPRVLGAHLAPMHRVAAFHGLSSQVRHWLEHFGGRPGAMIPKALYQSVAGSITSEHFRGKALRVYRPDWGNAIADNSWASVLRRVYRAHESDSRFVPVRVNVDAVYYPRELAGVDVPGLPMGDAPGRFRLEDEEVA